MTDPQGQAATARCDCDLAHGTFGNHAAWCAISRLAAQDAAARIAMTTPPPSGAAAGQDARRTWAGLGSDGKWVLSTHEAEVTNWRRGGFVVQELTRTPSPSEAQPEVAALRSIFAHWDEFGPHYDFAVVLDRYRYLLTSEYPVPSPSEGVREALAELVRLKAAPSEQQRDYIWNDAWANARAALASSTVEETLGGEDRG